MEPEGGWRVECKAILRKSINSVGQSHCSSSKGPPWFSVFLLDLFFPGLALFTFTSGWSTWGDKAMHLWSLLATYLSLSPPLQTTTKPNPNLNSSLQVKGTWSYCPCKKQFDKQMQLLMRSREQAVTLLFYFGPDCIWFTLWVLTTSGCGLPLAPVPTLLITAYEHRGS